MNNRVLLNENQLFLLVEAQINKLMKENDPFTSYSITLALRAESPRFEISHDDVREIVKRMLQMNDIGGESRWSDRWYDFSWQSWGGIQAMTYKPKDRSSLTEVAQTMRQFPTPPFTTEAIRGQNTQGKTWATGLPDAEKHMSFEEFFNSLLKKR